MLAVMRRMLCMTFLLVFDLFLNNFDNQAVETQNIEARNSSRMLRMTDAQK
jgi:hypothetical protein